jgi:protein-S-isoprenylcysteine O-methyltransferase Ste14
MNTIKATFSEKQIIPTMIELVGLTALMILPLLARIRAEEELLFSQFGDEYRNYCARTSRMIPGLY